jgi:hypothetical protein
LPSLAQITAADATLTATAQEHLLALIRGSDRYKANPGFYALPATAIAAASTTIKGKQLNAALALIDGVGDDTTKLEGGEEAVNFDPERDREKLISYCMSVLYEQPPRSQILTTSANVEQIF